MVGVIDAMEAVAVAAERLYSGEDVSADPATEGGELDDPWEDVPDEPNFRYEAQFDGSMDVLDADHELRSDETIEYLGVLCMVVSISPPDADGVRRVVLQRVHPDD